MSGDKDFRRWLEDARPLDYEEGGSSPEAERAALGDEVPVPKRRQFFANLKKVGKTRPSISYRRSKK